ARHRKPGSDVREAPSCFFLVANPASRHRKCRGVVRPACAVTNALEAASSVGGPTVRGSRLVSLLCVFASILCASAAPSQTALEYAPPVTTSLLPPNPHATEPGLLFYLSGDHGFNADFAAGGNPVPNYLSDVKIVP